MKRLPILPYRAFETEARSPRTQQWRRGVAVIGAALLLGACAWSVDTTNAGNRSPRIDSAAPAARLSYQFKPGESHHYAIMGLFTGHIPPFAHPGSPPITIKADLGYLATVKKVDDKGAQIEFVVDTAEVNLLEKEPGPDGKIDPDSETPFPIPLSEVQNMFNVTATLRSDGSVAGISKENTTPLKVNLGVDLHKLFLLMTPVIFPDRPVSVNDEWTYDDGVLGHNPGKTTYKSRLLTVSPEAKNLVFRIQQDAQSVVDTKMDKSGNPTDKPDQATGTLTGKVDVNGTVKFVTPSQQKPPRGSGAADNRAGRLAEGQLTMNAVLKRTRTAPPDPEHPEDQPESDIDVHARLVVHADDSNKPSSAKPASGGHTPKKKTSSPTTPGK